jgi:hypothetical protein
VRLSLGLVWFTVSAAACQPATTRPPFPPLPEATGREIRLPVPMATRRLAEALKADSIPTQKVRLRDGYIETPWFEARNGRPIGQRRAIGSGVVRIRAWADPARPGSSQLTVETLYRPRVDPSLPYRELERQVSLDHPVAKKVDVALQRLVDRFGGPPVPQAQPPQTQPPAGAGDSE